MKRATKIIVLVLIFVSPLMVTGQDEVDPYWEKISVVGFNDLLEYSHPTLFDAFPPETPDLIFDVISGGDNSTLIHQANTGTNSTDFELNPDESGIFSIVYERAAPHAFDYNNDGFTDLLVGRKNGSVDLLLNTQTNFEYNNSLVRTIHVSSYAKPTTADIDNNGQIDIIVGDANGGLTTYLNNGTTDEPIWIKEESYFQDIELADFASPFAFDGNNDGLTDFIVGSEDKGIAILVNTADKNKGEFADFTLVPFSNDENPFASLTFSGNKHLTPSLFDLDGNGDLDLIVGSQAGGIEIFLNFNYDLTNLPSDTFRIPPNIIYLIIGIFVVGIIATALIVRRAGLARGIPLYLLAVQSTGPTPYQFVFKEEMVDDMNLAGGAFTGVQAIISEVTSSSLTALDAGENKILITKQKFPNYDLDVQILLWATADDPRLRQSAENLAKYIVDHFEESFESGMYESSFTGILDTEVKRLFAKWF